MEKKESNIFDDKVILRLCPDIRLELLKYKKKLFAKEYIKHFNSSKAYKALNPDISDSSSHSLGYRYLKDKEVQEYILEFVNNDISKEENIIGKVLDTPTPKTISYQSLHSYIVTSLKLKGKLQDNNNHNNNINIGLVIKE